MLIIKILTILFCTCCLLKSLRQIYNGNCAIQYLGYLIVYFFFVFPVLFQLVFPYTYEGFYQANDALKNNFSYSVYCFFLVILSNFMVLYRPKRIVATSNKIVCNTVLTKVCAIVIFLSLAYTLLTNGIGILFAGYGARLTDGSYKINETFISCALICYLVLLGQIKKIKKSYTVLSTLAIMLLMWIHGKRFILVEFVILAIFVLFITRNIKGRNFVYLLFVCAFVVIALSYAYGVFIKQNANSLLEYFSIDLSRHYTLIYQIYCSHIGKQISVNEFDAITGILLFWVPRGVWASKPYPFCNALTHSLIGHPVTNTNLGWSTTVSIFSDLFDSFSYFGLIFGIVLIVIVCNAINKLSKLHYKILGIYFLVNLLTVQLVASLTCTCLCLLLFIVCDWLANKKDYSILNKLNKEQLTVHAVAKRR